MQHDTPRHDVDSRVRFFAHPMSCRSDEVYSSSTDRRLQCYTLNSPRLMGCRTIDLLAPAQRLMHPLGNFDGSEDIEVRLRSFVMVKPNLTLYFFSSDIVYNSCLNPYSTSINISWTIDANKHFNLPPITTHYQTPT